MHGSCTSRTVLLLSLCLCVCVFLCAAEVFSSVSKMKTLPSLERQVLSKFEDFLKSAPDGTVTELLRRKIRRLQKSNSKSLENKSSIECPLHAFRLVKRLVKEWSATFTLANKVASSCAKLKDFVNATRAWISKQKIWPSHVDLSGAATAIVRLHHVYRLSYTPLLQGHFLNVTSQPMTSQELAYVTKAALKLGFICDAKELLSALESLSEREGLEKRASSVLRLRKELSNLAMGTVSECQHNHSVTVPSFEVLYHAPEQTRKEAVRTLYHQMCRKAMQAAIIYGSGKRCYFHSTRIPYLKFKAELVNSDPFIVVFHDVINDDEIREMKELSFAKLSPSTLAVAQVAHENKLVRVSQNTWLFDWSPVVSRLSRRVQLITGLSTRVMRENSHAEPYQVVNYGVGGMNGLHEDSVVLNYGLGGVYGPHEDSVRVPRYYGNENTPELRNSGDRTATWMYYLSDVTLGGATVFPLIGAGIRPQKGTAAFWYNLKRNGQGDVRMVHAGCPVLYGDKWVANKWMREVGSTFTRPCLLEPNL